MARVGFAAASACLALCGCGAYDLAGMPRVVANGGFAPNQPGKAAENRVREERRDRELAIGHRENQQSARERQMARFDAERLRLDARRADLRAQLDQRGLSREAAEGLRSRIGAVEREIARVDDHIAELSDQQVDSLVEGEESAPLPSVGRTAAGRLETFPERFVRHALAAQASEQDSSSTTHAADVQRMLQSGYLLVQANCDDFFSRMSVVQRDADIGRDMIAPIITLLTGIVAARSLTEDESDDLLHIFNIAGNAAVAGISIVDQRFLFGAENIVEVRDLTFDAFQTSEDEIGRQVEEQGALTFDGAARRLIDYQLICTPSYIARLTRGAISRGQVVPDTNAPPPPDNAVRAALAQMLDTGGRTTDRQTRALYGLFVLTPDLSNIDTALVTELQTLGLGDLVVAATTSPVANAHLSAEGTGLADEMREKLLDLSPGAQERYRDPPAQAQDEARDEALFGRRSPRSRLDRAPAARPSNPGRRVRLRVE